MLTTSEALGRWIQVFVEAQFKRGESDDPNDDSGYVRVILKDQSGIQLYPLGNETGYKKTKIQFVILFLFKCITNYSTGLRLQ